MINSNKTHYLEEFLPFYNSLCTEEKNKLISISSIEKYFKGDLITSKYSSKCSGIILILEGRVRSFIHSDFGKEITIFRLLSRDLCLLSASCAFKNISYDVSLEAECDSLILVINGEYFKNLCDSNFEVQSFLLNLTQDKLSETLCLIEDLVFLSFNKRLSKFLVNECFLCNSKILNITHDSIANNLGSAREVVSRMLKKFEKDGIVKVSRGKIEILDSYKLSNLANE
ncbi:MAG: Crp/Fnr family transcriptional regulator [Clostridium sp.]|uniref:Crp/Fnr family transcriptional regulator n=1 Tax=Clostridium sp. TaxID=1506 RepID=UPI003F325548